MNTTTLQGGGYTVGSGGTFFYLLLSRSRPDPPPLQSRAQWPNIYVTQRRLLVNKAFVKLFNLWKIFFFDSHIVTMQGGMC